MRLLILTILVSGAVLLLLARIRFPETSTPVDTAAQPLERLAARASFEDLATRIARLEASIGSSLVVLRLAPEASTRLVRFSDLLHAGLQAADVWHVPALRIDATTAVAAVPPSARIAGIVSPQDVSGTAGIVAADPWRHVARLRVPEGPFRQVPQLSLTALETPAYIVAAEGTRAGVALRPVFVGRSARFAAARWSRPLLPLGGAVVVPGALLFTLEGAFLGCAVVEDGTLAIAGARDVLEAAERAGPGGERPADPGLVLQALTPSLAAATGATHGAVVAEVASEAPAAGVLQPADVVTSIAGQPVGGPEWLLSELGRRLAGGPVAVTVLRAGQVVALEIGARPGRAEGADDEVLQAVRGTGTAVVRVRPGSPLARGGVVAGDVILRAGARTEPSPADLRAALGQTPPGRHLLLVVRRGAQQHVAAIEGAAEADAPGR